MGCFILLISSSILLYIVCIRACSKAKIVIYNIYYFHIFYVFYLIYYNLIFLKLPNIGTVF